MIIKTQEVKNIIKAKGKLVSIDDIGLNLIDPKTDEKETLTFDELKLFIGRQISLSVGDSTKDEIITPDVEDSDEGYVYNGYETQEEYEDNFRNEE